MRTVARIWIACLLPLCVPVALGAQNLLTNPDFDQPDGLAPWLNGFVGATWSLVGDSGTCTLSESAEGTSVTVGDSQALKLYSPVCLAVDSTATPMLYLGGRHKTAANVWVRLYLQFFSDGSCGSHLDWSEVAYADNSTSWGHLVGPVTIPEAAGSAKFWLDFNPKVTGLQPFDAGVDALYAGEKPLLFADGFEADAGSACRWSAAVGAGS